MKYLIEISILFSHFLIRSIDYINHSTQFPNYLPYVDN